MLSCILYTLLLLTPSSRCHLHVPAVPLYNLMTVTSTCHCLTPCVLHSWPRHAAPSTLVSCLYVVPPHLPSAFHLHMPLLWAFHDCWASNKLPVYICNLSYLLFSHPVSFLYPSSFSWHVRQHSHARCRTHPHWPPTRFLVAFVPFSPICVTYLFSRQPFELLRCTAFHAADGRRI